jgi:TnpA family transposase
MPLNYQHRHPMSRYWGGGTLSSSDNQRFPVSGKVCNTTALQRYFGYGRGMALEEIERSPGLEVVQQQLPRVPRESWRMTIGRMKG